MFETYESKTEKLVERLKMFGLALACDLIMCGVWLIAPYL